MKDVIRKCATAPNARIPTLAKLAYQMFHNSKMEVANAGLITFGRTPKTQTILAFVKATLLQMITSASHAKN